LVSTNYFYNVFNEYVSSSNLETCYLAFIKNKRLVAFMGDQRMNPLLISKTNDDLSTHLTIERKHEITEVDSSVSKLDGINLLLEEIKIDEPNVYIGLESEVVDQILEHYDNINILLDDFIDKQNENFQFDLDKSKKQLIRSCRALFLIDMKNNALKIILETIDTLRINPDNTLLVSRGRLYGHYINNPVNIVQQTGIYTVDDVDMSECPTIFFELDFQDLITMLKNNMNIIGIMSSDKNKAKVGTDSLQVNDYICFYSDSTESKELDFYCLVLPSYLK
jgi:hypothetical protein